MTYATIGRAVCCLLLGVGLLATIVALVPTPLQVVAALVALPVESLLLAVATSTRQHTSDRFSSQLN